MSDNQSGGSPRSILPSIEFQEYCEAELERRRNSGDEFDEQAFKDAMQMALKKLNILEEEEGLV